MFITLYVYVCRSMLVCSLYASLRLRLNRRHYYSTRSLIVVTKKLALTVGVTHMPIILVVNNTTLTNPVLAMATACTKQLSADKPARRLRKVCAVYIRAVGL